MKLAYTADLGSAGQPYGFKSHNCHHKQSGLAGLYIKTDAIAADALGLSTDDIPIDGFSLTDWLNDIKEFAEVEHARSMLADLRATEKKLDSLLSVDKKTELELNNLAASLEADDKNE